jgi:hypothetical protein
MQISPFKTEQDFANAAPPPEGYYLRWIKRNADGTATEYIKDHTGTVRVLNTGGTGGGIPEAPEDGKTYGRRDGGWSEVTDNETPGNLPDPVNPNDMLVATDTDPSNDPNTTLLMHFDESDAEFTDASMYENTITNFGATYSPNGKFGGCAVFNGTQYLQVSTGDGLDWGTGAGTVEFLMYGYEDANTSSAVIAAPGNWGAGGISISFDRSGRRKKIEVWIYDHKSGSPSLISSNEFDRLAWHHVALVRYSNTIMLFVNGTVQGSITVSSSLTINWQGSGNHSVIGYNEADSLGFKGMVDELRVTKGKALYLVEFSPPEHPYGGGLSWEAVSKEFVKDMLGLSLPIPATATEDAVTDPDTGIVTVKLRPVTVTENGAEWDGAEVTAIVGWTAPQEG